jgi:hypothetical protein
MQFRGIDELAAAALDDEVVSTVEALERCAEDGTLLAFLETNKDLLKQERCVSIENERLFCLYERLGNELDWAIGKPLNVARYFEDHGIDLQSRIGELGSLGLFERGATKGEWQLTRLGGDFHIDHAVCIPKSVWVQNAKVVRESNTKVNFMAVLGKVTKS